MVAEVEEAIERNRHKESWHLINSISGIKSTKQGIIKGSSHEERLKKWYDYFQNLLGKVPIIPDENIGTYLPSILDSLDITDTEFTNEELQFAKKSIKEGKSSGPDNIAPEILKRCYLDEPILYFANKLLIEGMKPKQLSEIDLLPIQKSGDLSNTKNYRDISLSSVVAKLINKMIPNRLQPKMDNFLRNNQNGFRPGRFTTTHILALRRLIEEFKAHNKKAIILYVDFRKAFDSIHKGKMLKILKAYDVPPNLLNPISLLYEDTKPKIITQDGDTDFFQIASGILQGDTLAPYLFVIVLDYAMRMTLDGREEEFGFILERQRSRRVNPKFITDFADDIALISEEITQAQEVLSRLENDAAKDGLYCNSDKTKYQAFNQDHDQHHCLVTND